MLGWHADVAEIAPCDQIDRTEANGRQISFIWTNILGRFGFPYILLISNALAFDLREFVQFFDGYGFPIVSTSFHEIKQKMGKNTFKNHSNAIKGLPWLASWMKRMNARVILGHIFALWKYYNMTEIEQDKIEFYDPQILRKCYLNLSEPVQRVVYDLDVAIGNNLVPKWKDLIQSQLTDEDKQRIDQETKEEYKKYRRLEEEEADVSDSEVFENESYDLETQLDKYDIGPNEVIDPSDMNDNFDT